MQFCQTFSYSVFCCFWSVSGEFQLTDRILKTCKTIQWKRVTIQDGRKQCFYYNLKLANAFNFGLSTLEKSDGFVQDSLWFVKEETNLLFMVYLSIHLVFPFSLPTRNVKQLGRKAIKICFKRSIAPQCTYFAY